MTESCVQQFLINNHIMASLQNLLYKTRKIAGSHSGNAKIFNKEKIEPILENIVFNQSYSRQSTTFAEQQRVQQQVNQYFHSQLAKIQQSVGVLLLEKDNKLQVTGSGILLFSRIVVTCAHCVLRPKSQPKAISNWKIDRKKALEKAKKQLFFYVRPSNALTGEKTFISISDIIISPQYLRGNEKKDWAIIILDKSTELREFPELKIVIPDKTILKQKIENTYYIGFKDRGTAYSRQIINKDDESFFYPFRSKSQMEFYHDQDFMIKHLCLVGSGSSGGPLINIRYTSSKQFHLYLIGIHKSSSVQEKQGTGCTFDQYFQSFIQDLRIRLPKTTGDINFIYLSDFKEYFNMASQLTSFSENLKKDTSLKYLVQFLQKIFELANSYLFLNFKIAKKKYSGSQIDVIQKLLGGIYPILDERYDLSEYKIDKIPVQNFMKEQQSLQNEEQNGKKALIQSLDSLFSYISSNSTGKISKLCQRILIFFKQDPTTEVIQRLFVLVQLFKQVSLDDLLILLELHNQKTMDTLADIIGRVKLKRKNNSITNMIVNDNSLSRINIFAETIANNLWYEKIANMNASFLNFGDSFQDRLQKIIGEKDYRQKDIQLYKIIHSNNLQNSIINQQKRYKILMLRAFAIYYNKRQNKIQKEQALNDNINVGQFANLLIEIIKKQIKKTIRSKLKEQNKWFQEQVCNLQKSLKQNAQRQFMYFTFICLNKQNIMYQISPGSQRRSLAIIRQQKGQLEQIINNLTNKIDKTESKLENNRKDSMKRFLTRQLKQKYKDQIKKLQDYLKQLNQSIEQNQSQHLLASYQQIQQQTFENKQLAKKWKQGPQFRLCCLSDPRAKDQNNFETSNLIKNTLQIKPTMAIYKGERHEDQCATKFSQIKPLLEVKINKHYHIYYEYIGSIMYLDRCRKDKDYQQTGTGIMFGRGLVLTAYHTIQPYIRYNQFIKGGLKFKIIDSQQKHQQYDVVRVKICKKYDWAILYLQKKNEEKKPFDYPFKIITFNDTYETSFLVGKSYYCQIVGFLHDKKDALYMSAARIFINQNYKSTIQYTNSTSNRMSGGAVLIYPTGKYGQKPFVFGIHLGGFKQESSQIYGDKYCIERYNFGVKIIKSELKAILKLTTPEHQRTAIDPQTRDPVKIQPQKIQQYHNELNKNIVHQNAYCFSDYAYEKSKSTFIQSYYKLLKVPDASFIKLFIEEIIKHGECDIFFTQIDFQNILNFSDLPNIFINRLFNVKIRAITAPNDNQQYKKLWTDTIESCRQAVQNFYIRKEIGEFFKDVGIAQITITSDKKIQDQLSSQEKQANLQLREQLGSLTFGEDGRKKDQSTLKKQTVKGLTWNNKKKV